MADLTMYRGDTRTVAFTFSGASTFEIGDVVRFTAKRTADDTDATAVVALSSTNGGVTLNGATATATIPPAATDTFDRHTALIYDWQLTNGNGDVHTLDVGRIIVTPDITRTP